MLNLLSSLQRIDFQNSADLICSYANMLICTLANWRRFIWFQGFLAGYSSGLIQPVVNGLSTQFCVRGLFDFSSIFLAEFLFFIANCFISLYVLGVVFFFLPRPGKFFTSPVSLNFFTMEKTVPLGISNLFCYISDWNALFVEFDYFSSQISWYFIGFGHPSVRLSHKWIRSNSCQLLNLSTQLDNTNLGQPITKQCLILFSLWYKRSH